LAKGRIADPSHLTAARVASFDLDPHLIDHSLALHESVVKWNLGRFSRFGTAHLCDPHTDRQTTLRAPSVGIGRILCSVCWRCDV